MMSDTDPTSSNSPLPPARRRARIDHRAARSNDLLRAELVKFLRRSGRYTVIQNFRVPLTAESRRAVCHAKGGYIGLSLPCHQTGDSTVLLDMVAIDNRNRWAGGYKFCWRGSHSPRARRRLERELREVELVLRAWLNASTGASISAATVGIIDGSADAEQANDLTIALSEIGDHFDLPFAQSNVGPSALCPDDTPRLGSFPDD